MRLTVNCICSFSRSVNLVTCGKQNIYAYLVKTTAVVIKKDKREKRPTWTWACAREGLQTAGGKNGHTALWVVI